MEVGSFVGLVVGYMRRTAPSLQGRTTRTLYVVHSEGDDECREMNGLRLWVYWK